jgi:hypothetical protein
MVSDWTWSEQQQHWQRVVGMLGLVVKGWQDPRGEPWQTIKDGPGYWFVVSNYTTDLQPCATKEEAMQTAEEWAYSVAQEILRTVNVRKRIAQLP